MQRICSRRKQGHPWALPWCWFASSSSCPRRQGFSRRDTRPSSAVQRAGLHLQGRALTGGSLANVSKLPLVAYQENVLLDTWEVSGCLCCSWAVFAQVLIRALIRPYQGLCKQGLPKCPLRLQPYYQQLINTPRHKNGTGPAAAVSAALLPWHSAAINLVTQSVSAVTF